MRRPHLGEAGDVTGARPSNVGHADQSVLWVHIKDHHVIARYDVRIGVQDTQKMVEENRISVFFDQGILDFCPTQGTRYLVLYKPRVDAPRVERVIPGASDVILGSGVDVAETY